MTVLSILWEERILTRDEAGQRAADPSRTQLQSGKAGWKGGTAEVQKT